MPRTPSTWPAMATGSSRSTGGGVACTSLPSGLVGRCVGQGLRRHRFCRAVAGAAHRRFSRLSRAVLCGAGGKPAADWKSARPAAGAAAAMLVLGNHLWFTLSTLCLSSTRADSCGPKSSSTRQQPIPTTQENQVLFLLKRLFLMDPVFSIAALAAIPALWRTYRRRESEATVFFAGLAVVFANAFLRSYRNVTCLAPAIPALAILVARAIPPRIAFPDRDGRTRCQTGGTCTSLDPRPPTRRPAPLRHPARDYTRQLRHGELIRVDPFDGFYSSVLPLPKDRYCFVSPSGVPPQGPLGLHYLGIVIFRRRVGASAGIGRRVAVTPAGMGPQLLRADRDPHRAEIAGRSCRPDGDAPEGGFSPAGKLPRQHPGTLQAQSAADICSLWRSSLSVSIRVHPCRIALNLH